MSKVFDVECSYGPEYIGLLVDNMPSTRTRLVLAASYMPGVCQTFRSVTYFAFDGPRPDAGGRLEDLGSVRPHRADTGPSGLEQAAGLGRRSRFQHAGHATHCLDHILSGIIFRPFMFLALPGLALLLFALYVVA